MRGQGASVKPRTRGDCLDAPRPCRWRACRYHLAAGPDSCALDVADRGPQELLVIGAALGVTRERARQIQVEALDRPRVLAALRAWYRACEAAADRAPVAHRRMPPELPASELPLVDGA